jgi:predicted pyridoxine 5'-phosphate oxidase superfamily flavin-nucleotide-binding protein
MAIALSADVRKLIDGPNFAHLSTIMPDGSPQNAPVWALREGDRILVGTSEGSLKARNARRDPRVALSIVDPTFAVKDVTARKYTGKEFPWRNPGGVTLFIEVERAKFAKLPFTHAPAGAAR